MVLRDAEGCWAVDVSAGGGASGAGRIAGGGWGRGAPRERFGAEKNESREFHVTRFVFI